MNNIFDTRHLTIAEKIEIGAMSTICPQKSGYGVILMIFSNEHNPPHFHVLKQSTGKRTLCRYVLTRDCPESIQDLIPMKGDVDLPRCDKEAIVKWASATDDEARITNWNYSKIAWKKETIEQSSCFPTIKEAKNAQDLIPLKGDTDLPRRDKEAIVEWAKAQYKDTNYTNWKHAQYTWEDEADTDIEMEFPTIKDAKEGKIYLKKNPTKG